MSYFNFVHSGTLHSGTHMYMLNIIIAMVIDFVYLFVTGKIRGEKERDAFTDERDDVTDTEPGD